FEIGPEAIWGDSTGGQLLNGLLHSLFSIFLFAGLFLPLLMNFGLMELFGTFTTLIMRPLFKLPGRSSIEFLASLIGAGTIGLLYSLVSLFLFAGLFLPLLMNFGLMELFGTFTTLIMRPLFKLPGRSSIDSLASWIGDGTIGVLLTSKQYEDGFYTKREAAV